MKRIILLLFLFPAALHSFEMPQYQYISPAPGSRLVSPWNNIVIRHGGDIDDSTIGEGVVLVEGSRSGLHPGLLVLSDDSKTLVFKPNSPFALGEQVTVRVVPGLRETSGEVLPPTEFAFHVSRIDPKSDWARALVERIANAEVPGIAGAAIQDYSDGGGHDGSSCDTLPSDYPQITVTTSFNPDPGFLFIAPFLTGGPVGHLTILDNTGSPLFYRRIPSFCTDFKVQPNGTATYYKTCCAVFYALNGSYAIVDSFSTGNGYFTDLHELQVLPDGHSLLMSYDPEIVRMDTIVEGGDTAATVLGLIIQELDATKNVVFQWRSWDHFAITDGEVSGYVDLDSNFIDYVHGNSIEQDIDGNLIISSRHMNEITKINIQTGDIIWRLGLNAANNQFTFVNDERGFSHQHDARRLPNGHLTLFDNGNFLDPEYSRALEYELDEQNMTATLVWEYRNTPDTFGGFMGDVQRHENGGTMIGWGGEVTGTSGPRLTELHADGSKALEIDFTPFVWTYRAFRFPWEGDLFQTSSDSIGFGYAAVGDSALRALNVTNNSSEHLTINCLANSVPSFSSLTTFPIAIPPQSTIGITLMFKPDSAGHFTDRLYVRSVNDTQLVAQVVLLTGTTVSTSVNDHDPIPSTYRLYQNYPNPFNPVTRIGYDVPEAGRVTIAVFDLLGQEVASLVDETKPAGQFEVVWNGTGFADGVYIYRLTTERHSETKKMILLK